MWIRSQNKKRLVELKGIIDLDGDFDVFDIVIYVYSSTSRLSRPFVLGNYSTKEKGIKVLDMIQKKLESEGIYKGKEVFQMPQDDEVRWKI